MTAGEDVRRLRSIAVTVEDVVDAFVYSRENPGRAVLRVTPPFHGRMRARLHVYHVDDAPVTGAVHLDPGSLLEDDVVDAYPSVEGIETQHEDTAAETRRERHAAALDRWRERARTAIVDSVAVDADGADHEIRVSPLGGSPEE